MEIYFADLNYQNSAWLVELGELIEEYSSLIWTKRWQAFGDFVLTMPVDALKGVNSYDSLIGRLVVLRGEMSSDMTTLLRPDDYMLIEKVTLTYDAYARAILVIEGNDLVSLLGRRIIWGQSSFRESQTVKEVVDTLVNESIISPTDSDRQIYGFNIDSYSASDTIEALQRSYDNVYDTIIELCKDKYSPEVTLDSGILKFKLYAGTDRTLATNDPLTFSEELDNLEKYEYLKDLTEYKNAWLCAGEGEGADRITVSNTDGQTGIARRELYIDARDISQQDEDGEVPLETYEEMLQTRIQDSKYDTWINELSTAELTFEGKTYGVDYFVGDKATLIDPLGNAHTIRITEFIRCDDSNGYSEFPNFEII